MTTKQILNDLETRKVALSKQAESLPDFANDEDELTMSAEVNAKLDLIEELLKTFSE